jgi:hypothetical protein
MARSWHPEHAEAIELTLTRWRDELLSPTSAAREAEDAGEDDLRLFPIVGRDLWYPVATLLARGKLEDAGRLVSDRAWVASTPLYG